MCDELKQAFEKLALITNDDDKKFLGEAQSFIIKRQGYHTDYYLWKQHENIKFYRIYDTIENGFRSGPVKVGKRKPEKRIYIQGLPDHCF